MLASIVVRDLVFRCLRRLLILSASLSFVAASLAGETDGLASQTASSSHRMQWWREARFGLFVHWGPYSIAAGRWKGRDVDGAAEWIMKTARIQVSEYEALARQFHASPSAPEEWVKAAKACGAKYLIFTAKHHDGFAMYKTSATNWSVSGFRSWTYDPVKLLAEACRKHGVKLGLYYSILDWHHPDYVPKADWDHRPAAGREFRKYVDFMKAQLKELLEGYGPISVLWFDGEWDRSWTRELARELNSFVRSLQPQIIVNNRIEPGRAGKSGFSGTEKQLGDYGTPEQQVPSEARVNQDWEACMTIGDSWGYRARGTEEQKSSGQLVRMLVDCASKGGNFLLNIGPDAEGAIPETSQSTLGEIGAWMRINGESVYGTTGSPLPDPQPWGRVTRKDGKLYLHVFRNTGGSITVRGLVSRVARAYALADPLRAGLPFERLYSGVKVAMPASPLRSEIDTVIVVELSGPLRTRAIDRALPDLSLQKGSAVTAAVFLLACIVASLHVRRQAKTSQPQVAA